MSIRRNDVLVPSFMGFGVQLDPYAYPPGTEQWKQIESRLDRLHPAFLRVMFPGKDYCLGLSANGCTEYVWQQKGKKLPEQFEEILRILDYAQSHDTPVMIGEWSWPRLPHAADVAPVTGPGDPRWAAIIAPFLVYLRQDRGYTVLRFYNYMNEPNGGWMWKGGNAGVDYNAWLAGIKHARQVFDQNGLQSIRIVGPDNSRDWYWLRRTATDAHAVFGGWEMHWYPEDDQILDGYIYHLLKRERVMLNHVDPNVAAKPLFLGEMGIRTGRAHRDQQPRVRTFGYGVQMADFAAQIAQAGWMGGSAWYLDDAMGIVNGEKHLAVPGPLTLKLWGFWNSEGAAMGDPQDAQVRPWFRVWALLANLFPAHSRVFAVSNPEKTKEVRAIASELKTEQGNRWSIMFINAGDKDHPVSLKLPKVAAGTHWYVYDYIDSPVAKGASWGDLKPSEMLPANLRTWDHVIGNRTVVFLTTEGKLPE